MKNKSKLLAALLLISATSAFADEYKMSCYASHFVMGSNGYYGSEVVASEKKSLSFDEGNGPGTKIELKFVAEDFQVTLSGNGSLFKRTTQIDETLQMVTRSGAVTANVKIPERNIDLSLNDGLMIDIDSLGISEGVVGKSTVTIRLSDKPEGIYTVGCSMLRKME